MPDIKQMRLDGVCTVATIGACRDAVLQAFEGGDAISLDLRGVTDCDVTLPQLALAARQTAERRELPFGIAACSDTALASFVKAGVDVASLTTSFLSVKD